MNTQPHSQLLVCATGATHRACWSLSSLFFSSMRLFCTAFSLALASADSERSFSNSFTVASDSTAATFCAFCAWRSRSFSSDAAAAAAADTRSVSSPSTSGSA